MLFIKVSSSDKYYSKEKIGQLNKLARDARSLVSANQYYVYLSILLNQWLCADQTETSTSSPPLANFGYLTTPGAYQVIGS